MRRGGPLVVSFLRRLGSSMFARGNGLDLSWMARWRECDGGWRGLLLLTADPRLLCAHPVRAVYQLSYSRYVLLLALV